jgi:hypothetical protein|tara:strand:+ start:350 stop:748 length:399 start_codon:yes stop_codon:yes gene_type:complete
MDLVNVIKETRATKAQGSAEGRAKMKKGGAKTKASKSRVKVYDSITTALKKGYVGQIFSTKNSNRLYVITKRKWGKDDEQEVGGRVAKGFSPGSIPSKFADVKKYAVRTLVRHGKQRSGKFKSKKYWSRKQK